MNASVTRPSSRRSRRPWAEPGRNHPIHSRGCNLAGRLADRGHREEALAAAEEAVAIYRDLAAKRPDAYRRELEESLQVVARLQHGEDLNDAAPREPREW
jgi:hypothetical protein